MSNKFTHQNDITFSYNDLRYSVDESMLERARHLVLKDKLSGFNCQHHGCQALVKGTSNYTVTVANRGYDYGNCTCYMGQKNQLCKHMIALALYMLRELELVDSSLLHDLSQKAKDQTPKQLIASGCKKLQPYSGNSYKWFEYQNNLETGVAMIEEGLNQLPQDNKTAKYLFTLAQKIHTKISKGIDDSNGTVWPVIEVILRQVVECAKVDPKLNRDLKKWSTWDSGFGFEEILINHVKQVKVEQ